MRLTGTNRGKILCEKCRQPLSSNLNGVAVPVLCDICGAGYEGAFFKVDQRFIVRGNSAADIKDTEDAQCFFHPGKEAVEVCSVCGRMVCSLCDIVQSSGHICPSCINDRKRADIDGRPRRSWAYVQIAWLLLLVSFAIPVIPACASIFFSISGLRNKDYCCTAGRKVRLVIALLLAVPLILFLPVSIFMGIFA